MMLTAAERAKRLLDAGQLTPAMQVRAVELGLLAKADLAPAVQTKVDNLATIKQQAEAAMATNTAAIAVASPTNAQVVAHVKALSRQNNGIIRILLGLLDGTN